MPLEEVDEALQVDLSDIDVARQTDEIAELIDGFLEPGKPQRDARLLGAELALHRPEGADIADDAMKHVAPAHQLEGFRLGRVQRYAQLVKPAVDQLAALLRAEQRAVGIEQHIGAAILQIPDHAWQRAHHHRLADPVQHDAGNIRVLVDDRCKQLPAHIAGWFERLEGARAGRAQQVAAVGRLQIKADGLGFGNRTAIVADMREIAARIEFSGVRARHYSAAPNGAAATIRSQLTPRMADRSPIR